MAALRRSRRRVWATAALAGFVFATAWAQSAEPVDVFAPSAACRDDVTQCTATVHLEVLNLDLAMPKEAAWVASSRRNDKAAVDILTRADSDGGTQEITIMRMLGNLTCTDWAGAMALGGANWNLDFIQLPGEWGVKFYDSENGETTASCLDTASGTINVIFPGPAITKAAENDFLVEMAMFSIKRAADGK